MLKKLTVVSVASILICGCSTTATISRVNGTEMEAKIVRGTPGAVVVQTDAGTEVSIARSEIVDIDHPGNAAAVVGGFLSAYGVLNIASGASLCNESGAACTGVFLPAAVGVPMLIWGLSTWLGSTSAAGQNSSSSAGTVPEVPRASAFDFSPASHGGKATLSLVR